MKINLIVAGHHIAHQVYGIGIDNKLPWHCPADIRYFRKTTIGNKNNAIIIGRVTYDGIADKYKPFIDRLNVVMTTRPMISDKPNLVYVNDWTEALNVCKERNIDEVYIAGGQQIYMSAMLDVPIDNIYLSVIEAPPNTAYDTFFALPRGYKVVSDKTESNVRFLVFSRNEEGSV